MKTRSLGYAAFVINLVAGTVYAQGEPTVRIGELVADVPVAPEARHAVALAAPGVGVTLAIDSSAAPASVMLVPAADPLPSRFDERWLCATPCAIYAAPGAYRAVSRIGLGPRAVARLVLPRGGARARVHAPNDPTPAWVLITTGIVLSAGGAIAWVGANIAARPCTGGSCTLTDALLSGGSLAELVGPGILAAGLTVLGTGRGGVKLVRDPQSSQQAARAVTWRGWALLPRRDGLALEAAIAF